MSEKTKVLERDGLVLEMIRTFDAPRERVFDAFASLEAMSRWFGPATCDVQGGSLDFEVGGQYRLELQTEEYGRISVGGTTPKLNARTALPSPGNGMDSRISVTTS